MTLSKPSETPKTSSGANSGHSDEKWLAIAVEEVGELAEAILENNDEGILEEIVQVAAVLQNWVTSREFTFERNNE